MNLHGPTIYSKEIIISLGSEEISDTGESEPYLVA